MYRNIKSCTPAEDTFKRINKEIKTHKWIFVVTFFTYYSRVVAIYCVKIIVHPKI